MPEGEGSTRTRWQWGPLFRRLAILIGILVALLAAYPFIPYVLKSRSPAVLSPAEQTEIQDTGIQEAHAEVEPAAQESTWESEVFAETASAQLGLLGEVLKSPAAIPAADLSGLVSPAFTSSLLRPDALQTAFDSDAIRVLRWRGEQGDGPSVDGSVSGAAALLGSLAGLAEPLGGASDIHVKFKIYGVEVSDQFITTQVIYQASGRLEGAAVQQSAEWLCRWQQGSSGEPPLLERISLQDFEEVIGEATTGVLFADCTQAVFQDEPSFERQILPGIDYWRAGIQAQHGVYPYGHHGLCVGDVNGDGLDDVYACQPAGLPNRLYLQSRNGTVSDESRKAGVDWLDRSRGALLIDIDNDGDQDLATVVSNMIVFMANDGSGQFSEKSVSRPTGDAGGLVAADYDLDGDLDVFVVSYGQRFLSDGESSGPIPYHDANNGGPNMLLRNDGDWKFTDATQPAGLDNNNRRWSFAASWEDYDADGDFDLYVANDFGRNNLYRNDGGKFVDVAAVAGVEDIAAGMSASWGDYNRDGKMDLYVGNMFSSAGLRISNQARFHSDASDQMRGEFRRHARGNSLFRNEGDGTFRDVSEEADVTLGRWAWGSNFLDINNDGLEDLVVANGFVTGSNTKDL